MVCMMGWRRQPENILLASRESDTDVKITDFGVAKRHHANLKTYCGTPQYLAPEVLLGAADLEFDYTSYTEKVDMWAAGLILAEMAAGGPLFVVDSEIDLLFSIFRMLGTPDEESWPGLHDLACSIDNFPNWPVETRNLAQTFSILGSSGCDLLKKLLRFVCFELHDT